MRPKRISTVTTFIVLFLLTVGSGSYGASGGPALAKAKQDAEAKGYIFLADHQEIVEKAKTEGSLRVFSSLDIKNLNALAGGFKKKYPFINPQVQEIGGGEVYLRMIQEMKAGLATGWDVNYLAFDIYNDYLPHQKKFDILGMAKTGVLAIPEKMIDPTNRHVVVVSSDLQVVAYNRQLMSDGKIPDNWEGFLRPEFKERKFLLDIRPKDVSALVPAWGLERTLDFARRLAAQNPVWIRGNSRALTMVMAKEHAVSFGPNFSTVLRSRDKDRNNILGYKILEPVPTRLNEAQGILNTANHPFAALLWLEYLCSPEGQKIMDENEPYGASLLVPGSVQAQAAQGKPLSILDWSHYMRAEEYHNKILEAYGFPKAQK